MERKIHITVEYGLPGHEDEYIITRVDQNPSDSAAIKFRYFDNAKLQKLLPGYHIHNRGTRVEVRGKRDDDLFLKALQKYYRTEDMDPQIDMVD